MSTIKNNVIPVFFATDANYAPFLTVCLKSMLDNASKDYFYKIHVLTTQLDPLLQGRIKQVLTPNSTIEFVSLQNELDKIQDLFHLRDYYSKETYYRFFVPELYPNYDKYLYIDCDTIIRGDISELYNIDVKDYFCAAIREEVEDAMPEFVDYIKNFLGVNPETYFNAGVMLVNTKRFLKFRIAEKFVELSKQYTFRVTQDEDYLNVLFQNRVKMLDLGWNKTPFKNPNVAFDDKDLKLIHYKINWKPWRYSGVMYEEHFWEYAKQTDFYEEILAMRDSYGQDKKDRDDAQYKNLVQMIIDDSNDPNSYGRTRNTFEQNKAKGLVRINYLNLLKRLIGLKNRD